MREAPRNGLCVNVSMMFPDLALPKALDLVCEAGFDAVELWWPFPDVEPHEIDRDRFLRVVRESGLRVLMLNAYGGDIRAGDRGIAVHSEEAERFSRSIAASIDICRELDTPLLHVLVGNQRPEDRETIDGRLVEAVAEAALAAQAAKITVMVEPQNEIDVPCYPLHTIGDARVLVAAVASGTGVEIGVLLDLYHYWKQGGAQPLVITDGDLALLRHVQIADFPSRRAPGSDQGSPLWHAVETLIERGYTGAFGLEHGVDPGTDPFGWEHPLRDGRA
jgi:hydroxypyruvate isomerase